MFTLPEREKRLRNFFTPSLKLISEIGISQQEVFEIANAFKHLYQKLGRSNSRLIETIKSEYPFTFLVFLTGFATYNTEHDYWGQLAEILGVPQQTFFNYKWHKFYLEKASRLGLRTFSFDDTTTKYITTIRYHGGIPIYSLPDYFRHFVVQSVTKSVYKDMPTKDVLHTLMKTAYFVDAPVKNFLEYSGELGIDFFDLCRHMARRFIFHQEEISPQELGLPLYVVETFYRFMDDVDEDKTYRLHRPILRFSPSHDNAYLYLCLPEQKITSQFTRGQMIWEMFWDGLSLPITHLPRIFRQREDIVIEQYYQPIETIPQSIKVTLKFQPSEEDKTTKELRTWRFAFKPGKDDPPLMAFLANGGSWVPSEQSLPAQELILVTPKDSQISLQGNGEKTEDIGILFQGWQQWQADIWDLEAVWAVELNQLQFDKKFTIPIKQSFQEPKIKGETCSFNRDPDDIPLYIDHVPSLEIPILTERALVESLRKWDLEIRSIRNALPSIDKKLRLDSLKSEAKQEDDVKISLPLSCLLGDSPCGTYQIVLHHRQFGHFQYRFRLWDKLLPIGLEVNQVNHEDQQTNFVIRVQKGTIVEAAAGSSGVQIKDTLTGKRITADASLSQVHLLLKKISGDGFVGQIPVHIPIPRLHWSIYEPQRTQDKNLHWFSKPIDRSIKSLTQLQSLSLQLNGFNLNETHKNSKVVLCKLPSGEVLQEAALQPTPFGPDRWRIPLSQFHDTLARTQEIMQLRFVYSQNYSDDPIIIPMILLTHDLEVSNVKMEALEELSWKITWDEPYPIKNRRLLIQPAWQPWQEAWEYKVDDDAKGELLLQNVGIPASRYYLYFYTAPPWQETYHRHPDNIKPIIIELCTPETRLNSIPDQGVQNDQTFKFHFEKACIYRSLEQFSLCDHELSLCAKFLKDVQSIGVFLSLLTWIETEDLECPSSKFLINFAFHHNHVSKFLLRYPKNDPRLVKYFSYLSRAKNIYQESAILIAENFDDPNTVTLCLDELRKKENQELIPLLIRMAQKVSISDYDIVDVLIEKPEWSINQLLEVDETDITNRIISLLLQKKMEMINKVSFDRVYRIALIEKLIPVKKGYLFFLINHQYAEAFNAFIDLVNSGKMGQQELIQFVLENPKLSYHLLEKIQESESRDYLIDKIGEQNPHLVGYFEPDNYFMTTLGPMKVIKIENKHGRLLERAKLRDHDIFIQLDFIQRNSSERVQINKNKRKLTFIDRKNLYKCRVCEFVHPDVNILTYHNSTKHNKKTLGFRVLETNTISIDFSEIEILTELDL